MPPPIKLDVFGRRMLAERADAGWRLFELGSDGKRSALSSIVIPDFISESELERYLADMFHESATEKHSGVRRLTE